MCSIISVIQIRGVMKDIRISRSYHRCVIAVVSMAARAAQVQIFKAAYIRIKHCVVKICLQQLYSTTLYANGPWPARRKICITLKFVQAVIVSLRLYCTRLSVVLYE